MIPSLRITARRNQTFCIIGDSYYAEIIPIIIVTNYGHLFLIFIFWNLTSTRTCSSYIELSFSHNQTAGDITSNSPQIHKSNNCFVDYKNYHILLKCYTVIQTIWTFLSCFRRTLHQICEYIKSFFLETHVYSKIYAYPKFNTV